MIVSNVFTRAELDEQEQRKFKTEDSVLSL